MVVVTQFDWAVLGVLNFAVAFIVWRARPDGPANLLAAALIGTNTLVAIKQIALLGWILPTGTLDQALDLTLAAPPFVAFGLFPFFFPRRRLSRTGERWLLAGAGAFVLLHLGLIFGGWAVTGDLISRNAYYYPLFGATFFLPVFAGFALGAILLLQTYVSSPSRIQRDQARFVLAAYLLKIGSYLLIVLGNFKEILGGPPYQWFFSYRFIALFLLAVPEFAVVLTLATARLRHRGHGAEPRTWGEDLFVAGALVAGLTIWYPAGNNGTAILDLEFLLFRPVLFAYGVLQFQMLDVDLRRQRRAFVTLAVAAIVALFVQGERLLVAVGAAPDAAIGGALGLLAILAWFVLRPILARTAQPSLAEADVRGRMVYRAALEAALQENPQHRGANLAVLGQLRGRLGIGEREHQAIQASVLALSGRPAGQLAVGSQFLGQYRILRPLGEGGFGTTFLAHDLQIDRDIVVKSTRAADPAAAQRALREARAVAKLRDPHIVTLYHVDEVAGQVYLFMEYVEGGSLADVLAKRRLTPSESLRVFGEVLQGLEAAHGAGLVHGDVKPGNILLTRDGHAKLADFGIAQGMASAVTASGLTMLGAAGSLQYMSPEQVRGSRLDARSDLYSLAATWHEALTGQHYLGKRPAADFDLRVAIVERPAKPLPEVPAPLRAVLLRCLAKDPADRPQSAAEVRAALQSLAQQALLASRA